MCAVNLEVGRENAFVRRERGEEAPGGAAAEAVSADDAVGSEIRRG